MNIKAEVFKRYVFPTMSFHIERWRFHERSQLWVSTEGRLKNKNKEIVTPKMTSKGYLAVYGKCCNKGYFTVHQLVAQTWLPNDDPEHKDSVDHLNHNKRDNSIRNLEWVSTRENQKRAREDFILDPSECVGTIEKLKKENNSLRTRFGQLQKEHDDMCIEMGLVEKTSAYKQLPKITKRIISLAGDETPWVVCDGMGITQAQATLMMKAALANGCTKGMNRLYAFVNGVNSNPILKIGGLVFTRVDA